MITEAGATLRDLRRTRTRRRLGDIEWYDVAYRVYLFALVGLIVIVTVSDAIDGIVGDGVDTGDLLAVGPSIMGITVAVAFGLGLRSGADGGPVSVEVADIRHVLLSPVPRRLALLRPVGQRFRSLCFALAFVGGILGQLVATELEGSRAAWAASGALFGAIVGVTFVGSAVLAHVLRVPRWAATLAGATLLAWQGAAAWWTWNEEITGAASSSSASDAWSSTGGRIVGPADLTGRIAFWGIDRHPIDSLAIVAAAAVVAVSLAVCGRLRLEPLARRGELVSQLRFAATVQDLRTVVLLRRQLRSESLRSRPWFARLPQHSHRPVANAAPKLARPRARTATAMARGHTAAPRIAWDRGVRSLRRLPLARIARVAAMATIGGVAAALTVTSSPLFGILVGGVLFVVGLESLEPLSQEIDRPDLTDRLPVDRGWLYTHLLLAPAGLLALAGLVAALAGTAVDPAQAAGLFGLAVPVTLAGAVGPVVATIGDAPSVSASTSLFGSPRDSESVLVPPEFAGFGTVVRTLFPVLLSGVGVLPVYAMRYQPEVGTAIRAVIGLALFMAATLRWIRRRDVWGVKIREFFEQGRVAADAR